jgi:hypothetical protein
VESTGTSGVHKGRAGALAVGPSVDVREREVWARGTHVQVMVVVAVTMYGGTSVMVCVLGELAVAILCGW